MSRCKNLASYVAKTRSFRSLEQIYLRVRTQSGFTIAELIVWLGVFAILTAIAVPQYVAFQPGLRLNGAAREILAQLMWARAKAVEQNNNFVVLFPTNHTLLILDDKNNNGVADAGESTKTVDIQNDYSDASFAKAGASLIQFFTRAERLWGRRV